MEKQAPKLEVRSIDDFHLDPANVRRRDEETERMLKASVTTFKPFRSIAVDSDLVTRAGNGTLKAAQAAGVTEVLVVRPEPGQLVAVQRMDLTPTQLAAYAIADNRLTDRSTNDDDALVKMLGSLRSENVDLNVVGYTDADINKLIARLADDESVEITDGAVEAEFVECPKCHHRWLK